MNAGVLLKEAVLCFWDKSVTYIDDLRSCYNVSTYIEG